MAFCNGQTLAAPPGSALGWALPGKGMALAQKLKQVLKRLQLEAAG